MKKFLGMTLRFHKYSEVLKFSLNLYCEPMFKFLKAKKKKKKLRVVKLVNGWKCDFKKGHYTFTDGQISSTSETRLDDIKVFYDELPSLLIEGDFLWIFFTWLVFREKVKLTFPKDFFL